MTLKVRQMIIRWTVLVLTLIAFGGSYRHGLQWVHSHTDHGPGQGPTVWECTTAALPEVMVLVAVLSYPDRPRDPRVWVTGVTAVSWTLYANGANAGPGPSGLVVAMWPAWAALLALTLMGHPGNPVVDPIEPLVTALDQGQWETAEEAQARRVKARRARDQRAREAHREPVDRVKVFERDLWTCYLCGGSVDQKLSSNDPLGATLDHVIPLSGGGQTTYENVKLAHRKCNQAKYGVTNLTPSPKGQTSRDEGVKWALTHEPVPSAAAIMDHFDMSFSTAKRVRKAALEARSQDPQLTDKETS